MLSFTWLSKSYPTQFLPPLLLQIKFRLLDLAFEASGLNILHPLLPPIWSGCSTRLDPGHYYSPALWGPPGQGSYLLSKDHVPGLKPGTYTHCCV